LAAKNKDVEDLNFVIESQIVDTLHSFKSIDCVTNEHEVTNYPSEFLISLDVSAAQFTAEGWLGGHNASKPKPTKTMQWNAFGDKKTDGQCDSRDYTQRKIQR
jgi:hypothetical protein